jgi:hypothetical protein
MSDLRTAAQQALEALDKATRYMSFSDHRKLNEAITALKSALEQPERHVSYVCPQCYWSLDKPVQEPKPCPTCQSLARAVMMDQTGYDIPARREWIGLTDDEYEQLSEWTYVEIIERIENILKEKNA